MSFVKQKGSNKTKGICLLAANNDMSIYNAAANHESLSGFYSEFKTFEIDLSPIEEIDTTGIQLLLALSQSAIKDNKQVQLHSPSDAVLDVLKILNVTDQLSWKE